jgi:hypothetical protein
MPLVARIIFLSRASYSGRCVTYRPECGRLGLQIAKAAPKKADAEKQSSQAHLLARLHEAERTAREPRRTKRAKPPPADVYAGGRDSKSDKAGVS